MLERDLDLGPPRPRRGEHATQDVVARSRDRERRSPGHERLIGQVREGSRRIDDEIKAREAVAVRLAHTETQVASLNAECLVPTTKVATLNAGHDRLSEDLRAMEGRILSGVERLIEGLRREIEASGAVARSERR